MEATEKCPSCGENMEPGFVVFQRTISWCDHVPKVICLCGKVLSKMNAICHYVSGYRCKKCKILRYQEIEQVPKNETDD